MFKKLILISFSIFVFGASCSNNVLHDPIERAVNSCDDKAIARIIYYNGLLSKNKVHYLNKANELIEKHNPTIQSRYGLPSVLRYVKGSLSLGLSLMAFKAARESFLHKNDPNKTLTNSDISEINRWTALFGSFGTGLGILGMNELYKGWTNYDNAMCYYRVLAIRENLANMPK